MWGCHSKSALIATMIFSGQSLLSTLIIFFYLCRNLCIPMWLRSSQALLLQHAADSQWPVTHLCKRRIRCLLYLEVVQHTCVDQPHAHTHTQSPLLRIILMILWLKSCEVFLCQHECDYLWTTVCSLTLLTSNILRPKSIPKSYCAEVRHWVVQLSVYVNAHQRQKSSSASIPLLFHALYCTYVWQCIYVHTYIWRWLTGRWVILIQFDYPVEWSLGENIHTCISLHASLLPAQQWSCQLQPALLGKRCVD